VVVGVQRLADEVLGHERPVAVGGVDEVDAELDGRRRTRTAVSWSFGGPQTPSP
jgi:hypothetical protein